METWIESNGLKLKTYFEGSGNICLIYLHGFSGSCSFVGKEIMSELTNYFTCRFDFQGQGLSQGAFYDSCISDELVNIKDVVDYIKKEFSPKKIILITHSFGGVIAWLYTADNPVDGIVMLAGEGDLMKNFDGWEFSEKQLREVEEKGETHVENYSKNCEMDLLWKKFFDELRKYNTTEAAKKITCPMLFIYCKQDKFIPLSTGKEMYELVKGEKKFVVLDTDHLFGLLGDEPKIDAVVEEIKNWLKKF